MSNGKANLTGIAALITSLVAVAGFVFGIITYSIESSRQERVQKSSYESTKDGLEKFSSSVADEIKELRQDIQNLKVEVAVLKDRTRAHHSPPTEIPPAIKSEIQKVMMKNFDTIQKESYDAAN